MSDMGDMYRAMREKSRIHRHGKQEQQYGEILDYIEGTHVSVTRIADYHFRLTGLSKTVDVFPQTNKYHIVGTAVRGRYGRVTELICKEFQI